MSLRTPACLGRKLFPQPPPSPGELARERKSSQFPDDFSRQGPGMTEVVAGEDVLRQPFPCVTPESRRVQNREVIVADRVHGRGTFSMITPGPNTAGRYLEVANGGCRFVADAT